MVNELVEDITEKRVLVPNLNKICPKLDLESGDTIGAHFMDPGLDVTMMVTEINSTFTCPLQVKGNIVQINEIIERTLMRFLCEQNYNIVLFMNVYLELIE